MTSIRRLTWAVAIALALAIVPSAFANNNDDELRAQQDKQRAIQAETDHVVNRIATMLRVMKFYGVESTEKKVMEEMSDSLGKLSKNQMADVIRQLETAIEAKTEKQSEEAYEKAHASHLKVLDALHEMVARFDAVKTLDEAANRFEEHAKNQLKLHLRSAHAISDLRDANKSELVLKRLQKQGTEMADQSALQST